MPPSKKDRDLQQDKKFVYKAKQGDTTAFEKLIKKYQRRIYYVIARITYHHDITTDLVQDTFLKAFQSLYRFDESRTFYPWILRIAINTALNWLKHESIRTTTELNESNIQVVSDQNPVREVEQREILENVTTALNSLAEEQRIVFILRTYQEMGYDEIAETLQVSVGTVMSRLNRARGKMKKLMKDFL